MRIAVVNADGAPSVTPSGSYIRITSFVYASPKSAWTDASRQIREWRYASMKTVCPIGKCWWKAFQNWCTRQEDDHWRAQYLAMAANTSVIRAQRGMWKIQSTNRVRSSSFTRRGEGLLLEDAVGGEPAVGIWANRTISLRRNFNLVTNEAEMRRMNNSLAKSYLAQIALQIRVMAKASQAVLFLAGCLVMGSSEVWAHGKASSAEVSERMIVFPDIEGGKTLVTDLHMHSVFSDGHVWPGTRVERT